MRYYWYNMNVRTLAQDLDNFMANNISPEDPEVL